MNKRTKIILIAGGILLVGGVITLNVMRSQKAKLEVETQKIESREIRAVVSASGKIRPKISVDISASTTGKVVKLAVDEGDRVRKGQFLLQIDPTPAETTVRQIQASLQAAKANLALAQANFDNARKAYERQKQLFAENLTSEELLQQAKTTFEVQQLQTRAAAQEVKRIQAMLESAEHELSKVNVHSDIDGIVTRRNIEVGENVFVGAFNNAATVLLTIADLSVIEAEVEVDETDIVAVKVGQQAEIKIDAWPDSTFRGEVTRVGHSPIVTAAGQQQATSFEVIIQLLGTVPDVRPGLSCKADITTGYREKAVAVPIQALTLRKASSLEPKPFGNRAAADRQAEQPEEGKEKELQGVFVVEDGSVHFREVEIGIAGDRFFEVKSGLSEGEEVITGPFSALRKLKNGDAIRIRKSPVKKSS